MLDRSLTAHELSVERVRLCEVSSVIAQSEFKDFAETGKVFGVEQPALEETEYKRVDPFGGSWDREEERRHYRLTSVEELTRTYHPHLGRACRDEPELAGEIKAMTKP